jgi:hypothetical protein
MTRNVISMGLLMTLLAAPLACDKLTGKPKAGDSCSTQDEADCKDDKSIVTCDQGKYIEYPCKGPAGCKKEGVLVKCDESLGADGDACSQNDNFACTTDNASQLKCADHKWKVVSPCRGPNKCKAEGLFVKCDTTIAKAGDTCDKDGDAACSDDSKTILECKGNKFEEKQKCPSACEVKGIFVQCKEG